jgi:hypothetical protein
MSLESSRFARRAIPPRERRAETGALAPARVGRNHGAPRLAQGFRPTPVAPAGATRPPLAGRDDG